MSYKGGVVKRTRVGSVNCVMSYWFSGMSHWSVGGVSYWCGGVGGVSKRYSMMTNCSSVACVSYWRMGANMSSM